MLKKLASLIFGARGKMTGRRMTHDSTFPFRMGAGMLGDVNRTHPAGIEPCLIDASAPPTAYGQAVLVDATTQGVRPLVSGDSSLDAIYGVTVRPYPIQAPTGGQWGASAFGAATPPTSGVIDVLRQGYIMVYVNPALGATVKGGRVFIWVAASSGNHTQGGFEIATGGGSNTIELDEKSYYNGVQDANGIVELEFNV